MAAFEDITGQRFGKLVVLGIDGLYANAQRRWLLRCDCGIHTHAPAGALRAGQSRQCRNCYLTTKGTHRQTRTRLYGVWQGMLTRCRRKSHIAYHRYGGRGITVCDEWQRYEPFAAWARANGYRDDLQIDRIDNDRGYEPANCRFVSPSENTNNRRDTAKAVFFGQEMALADAARRFGIRLETLRGRIAKGLPPDIAATFSGRISPKRLKAYKDTPQCKELVG